VHVDGLPMIAHVMRDRARYAWSEGSGHSQGC